MNNASTSVLYEFVDNVAVVTLNEGERMNPLTKSIQEGLLNALDRIRADRSVRAMLLTANGRGFCSGADLRALKQQVKSTKEGDSLGRYVGDMLEQTGNPIVMGLRTLPVPVICAVNGAAAGGGFGLALAADLVIAARSAFFYSPFVSSLGIVPDMGATWMTTRAIGRARTTGLMLTGCKITAAKALEWGLIWDCVDDHLLKDEAMKLAQQLALLPAHAIQETRSLVNVAEENTLSEQLDLEKQRQIELIDGESFAEGLLAFFERRTPQFKGRK